MLQSSSGRMQTSFRRETGRIGGGLMKVDEMMSKNLFCCTPTNGIQQAAKLMKDNDVGAIPVVNDCNERKLMGIITDRDICVNAVAMGKSIGTTSVYGVLPINQLLADLRNRS